MQASVEIFLHCTWWIWDSADNRVKVQRCQCAFARFWHTSREIVSKVWLKDGLILDASDTIALSTTILFESSDRNCNVRVLVMI